MTSDETITRVLFVTPRIHVYAIPPLSSSRGHVSASWTQPPVHEFPIQRLRVIETSHVSSDESASHSNKPIQVSILIEDPHTSTLFAAAPYSSLASVAQAVDSSRFFAVAVVGEADARGRQQKAVLGIGFEERSEAFDFGVALQEAKKILGLEEPGLGGKKENAKACGSGGSDVKRDWSLKEGETLKINIGGNRERRKEKEKEDSGINGTGETGFPGLLPPPSSSSQVKSERRRSWQGSPGPTDAEMKKKDLEALGFDDGEFGEFQ